jgi:hypothetical protein
MSLNRNSMSNLNLAYNTELNLGSNQYQNSLNPQNTNVIPRQYNQQIYNLPQNGNTANDNQQLNGGNAVYSNLSGQPINKEGFHNNMVPFFRGSVKQNMNSEINNSRLEAFTGVGENIRQKKKEVRSFFDVSRNMSYNHGSPSFTNNAKVIGRYIPSTKRQGEKPFQDIRVGPGLAKGYTSDPSGGYTQANSREYILPKDTNELRVLTNPKVSYEGRIINGLKSGQRGLVAKPRKNRPETYYSSDPERGNPSAAIKSAMMRKKFCMKRTNKQNQKSYYGILGNSEVSKPKKESAYRTSTKNNYMNPSPRNAFRADGWKQDDEVNDEGVGDYGKSSIENKPNERDLTQVRTHRANLTTTVKKVITPLTDLFRRTRKENFVGNMRPDGNMKAAMPSKLTIYDPNDVARTTIKETNIHNEHEGFLQGGEFKGKVHDPNDVARTTLKELNIHNTAPYINMNPQQPRAIRVYDPEDVAKTTLKEVTSDNDHNGFIGRAESLNPGGYTTTNVSMKNTHKQFLTNYYYTGIADGEVGTGPGRGYLASNYKAKNTHKQFLSDYEYKGHAAGSVERAMSYSDKYNARLNPNKEEISKGRAPTQNSVKLAAGQDHVNISHRKLESDQINIREPAENKVYDAPPQKNSCGLTTIKDKLPEDVQRERIDPDLLNPFKNNPYTQSLYSAV